MEKSYSTRKYAPLLMEQSRYTICAGHFDYAQCPTIAKLGHRAESRQAEMTRTFIWRPDKTVNSGVYIVKATSDMNSIGKRIVYVK